MSKILSNMLENGRKCYEKCNFYIKYFDKIKCYADWPYLAFSELRPETHIQATPAMSTSRISLLPLMSKWFFIPNIFSLYFFAFQLCLCRKRLTRSNGYLEVIFHALDIFSIIFASVYVEVLNQRSHGRHIVCFGYVHVLAEVRTSSKQQ